jgi:hypothetical protein
VAYDEMLASRIRGVLGEDDEVVEKRMFGGLAFMCKGHMLAGVVGSDMVARVGKDSCADALSRSHVREMNFTGKPMSGFVLVDPDGLAREEDVRFWIERCRAFVNRLPGRNDK